MRVLGLDIGEKTIGVAVSDELGLAAHPVTTISRAGTRVDAEAVAALVAERGAEAVVVGMPLDLSGAEGRAARRVRAVIDALAARLPDLAIHEWDERFSTVAAERALIEADMSRRRRRKVIDQEAAAYILQGWLDARRQAG